MGKIIGLELGQNSIGWAIVDDGKMLEMGTRIFPDKKLTNKQAAVKQILVLEKIRTLTVN